MSSNLSLVEAKLPPGFRFHPKDEELICDYLMKKVVSTDSYEQTRPLMIEVDLNKCEPWDIPETASVGGKEWYFYSQRDRKYATGLRTNRATVSGYWKATGKDRPIYRRGSTLVGMRKTLVFYQGRAPKGTKTEWVMHEFRLEGPPLGHPPKALNSSLKEDWVLCRMFYKNREVIPPKQTLNIDDTNTITPSSSLPPLMDPYITFAQSLNYNTSNINNNIIHQLEQVPCFSIFNPTNILHMGPTKTLQPTPASLALGANPNFSSILNNPYSCDNKIINDFLDHIAKVESKGSTSLGDQGSSESFLSDVNCLPNNVWNKY